MSRAVSGQSLISFVRGNKSRIFSLRFSCAITFWWEWKFFRWEDILAKKRGSKFPDLFPRTKLLFSNFEARWQFKIKIWRAGFQFGQYCLLVDDSGGLTILEEFLKENLNRKECIFVYFCKLFVEKLNSLLSY